MTMKDIRPSTVEGIKRLAKTLKREHNLQHSNALDAAARAAGFENYRHAQNAFGTAMSERHRMFITAHWKSREDGSRGRETLTIWLASPWSDLITASQLANQRELAKFRAEGPDHLARWDMMPSQFEARRVACAAARTLQFMDATGLRPSKGHAKAYPGGRSINAVPGQDHSSIWYDSETKRYLLADEPYERAVEHRAHERAAWADQHSYVIAKPEWPGIYNPSGGSRLYLIADAANGIPLKPVVDALNRLPWPPVPQNWEGESAPFLPPFVSPGTLAKEAQSTRATSAPKRSGPRNTVGYVQTFVGPRRRPKGRMPIDAHTEVGALLKSVLDVASHRPGVYNQVDSVRSDLDEWVQREYNRAELSDDQFFELYYHGTNPRYVWSIPEPERAAHIQRMMRVKEILGKHYPDCAPLRDLLNKLDRAARSMQTWSS